MFCRYCGNQIRDEAVVCIYCGCPVSSNAEDNVNIGLCILAVIIPLFGFIYWDRLMRADSRYCMADNTVLALHKQLLY